jgi:predicted transcriptional regulator YdeE
VRRTRRASSTAFSPAWTIRLIDRPAFRLVGHAARVPLNHQGINPHIQQRITALPQEEHLRLKALGDTEPGDLLQVCDDLDADGTEGSELTYRHGVAVSRDTPAPDDLDAIEVSAGERAVFRTAGPHPQALQTTAHGAASRGGAVRTARGPGSPQPGGGRTRRPAPNPRSAPPPNPAWPARTQVLKASADWYAHGPIPAARLPPASLHSRGRMVGQARALEEPTEPGPVAIGGATGP